MNIHFISIDMFDDDGIAAGTQFLTTWYGWKGTIPEKDDVVILNWAKTGKEAWKVVMREIDSADSLSIKMFVSRVGKYMM